MKFRVKKPIVNGNEAHMIDIDKEQITFNSMTEELALSIDGSTTNSGIAIIRVADAKLLYSISAKRDQISESPVRYKLNLKNEIIELLIKNPQIRRIYYEEPCIGYASAVSNLFMLRTFIEELIIENEPRFNYLAHHEINNMRWKKLFLAPEKIPLGSENQKTAVYNKMITAIPCMCEVTQDEIDAYAMGFSVLTFRISGHEESELDTHKKSKFKYNIRFIGADTDDAMLEDVEDVFNGRQEVMENGIVFAEMGIRDKFDEFVYSTMGNEDKLLIIKYPSSKHGDLTLKYKIGHLAARYPYMYALVWRATPKKRYS